MGYCTTGDVQGKFKRLDVDSNSSISTTKMASMIANYSAIIDGKLSSVYTVPVTGENALLILNEICTLLVAAETHEILIASGALTEKDSDLGLRAPDMRKRADKMLADIVSGTMLLSDATAASSGQIRSSSLSTSDPIWKKHTRQW
jgi:hypothetical protein